MSDPSFERTLSYRLSSAYDCWGNRRAVRRGARNGVWYLDPTGVDECPAREAPIDRGAERTRQLADLEASGCFTPVERTTLRALVVEGLTIAEIAARDGCTRQAVLARLLGNSRHQGGILKKARALARRTANGATSRVPTL